MASVTLYNAIIGLPLAASDELAAYLKTYGQLPPDWPNSDYATGVWRNLEGYVVYDVQSTRLSDLDAVAGIYPDARIYGAWYYETGAQATPLRPDCIDLMPDIVTYDDDGNETGRQRPGACYDMHRWAGQAPRDWSQ